MSSSAENGWFDVGAKAEGAPPEDRRGTSSPTLGSEAGAEQHCAEETDSDNRDAGSPTSACSAGSPRKKPWSRVGRAIGRRLRVLKAVVLREEDVRSSSDPQVQEEGDATRPSTHVVLQHLLKWQRSVPTLLPDSKWRRIWDTVSLCVSFVPGLLVPLVMVGTLPYSSGLAAVTVAVSLFLGADALVRSRTAFLAKDGTLATSVAAVRSRYLRSWFFVDFLSAFPFASISYWSGQAPEVTRGLSSLALLRLCVVPTLFGSSNLPVLTPEYVTFNFEIVPKLRSLFWCVIALHFLVVLKLLVREEDVDPDDVRYDLALFWVWNLLTTSPAQLTLHSDLQRLLCFLLMIAGVFFQGVIIGKLSYELLKRSIQEQNVDTLRATLMVIKQFNVPIALQQEVLSLQWHALQSSLSALARSEIMESLPAVMRNEIILYMKMDFVEKVPMFAEAPPRTKFLLASFLSQIFVEPGSTIVKCGDLGEEMYFILHGFCDVAVPGIGTVGQLGRGQFFGEVALLTRDPRTADVVALTYCDCLKLCKADFDRVCDSDAAFKATIEAEAASRRAKKAGAVGREPPDTPNETTGEASANADVRRRTFDNTETAEVVRAMATDMAAQEQAQMRNGMDVLVALLDHQGREPRRQSTWGERGPTSTAGKATGWFGPVTNPLQLRIPSAHDIRMRERHLDDRSVESARSGGVSAGGEDVATRSASCGTLSRSQGASIPECGALARTKSTVDTSRLHPERSVSPTGPPPHSVPTPHPPAAAPPPAVVPTTIEELGREVVELRHLVTDMSSSLHELRTLVEADVQSRIEEQRKLASSSRPRLKSHSRVLPIFTPLG
eukprot:TRINITY_DN46847_c0_g1_i1.p1 TRINITY_DN46847_c0_g1~~TRINITY_DN46847_c0_g1_i1.p1  ORF type:complete len:836 (+),score=114.36 TRINITY_DN46847_c0_g1_i1:76-2583(+)